MESIEDVIRLLDLAEDGEHFVGGHPASPPARVFGGQVMAQALKAACMTVSSDRLPHSLHAYFVRGGRSEEPIRYGVERARDGGSVSSRVVTARQSEGTIFHMSVSLATPAPPPTWPVEQPPAAPSPDRLPPLAERLAPYGHEHGGWWLRPRPFDLRYVDPHPREAIDQAARDPRASLQLWVRAMGPVPQDPVVHACLAAYLSDMTLLDPVMVAARRTTIGPGSIASLDHAMWFHAIPDPGDWILYERRLVTLSGRRGLASGVLRDEQGRSLCTVAQEGHLSDRPAPAPRW